MKPYPKQLWEDLSSVLCLINVKLREKTKIFHLFTVPVCGSADFIPVPGTLYGTGTKIQKVTGTYGTGTCR